MSTLDTPTRLAYERTFLGHERTQMGWLRTALSLITFGFTIAKFFEFLRGNQPEHVPILGPKAVGILMISIGLIALTLGTFHHQKAVKALRTACPGLPASVAGSTSACVALFGILALIGAILRS